MIGLCTILQGPDPGTDPVKYLNRAFDHYSKVPGRQNRMLATRAMLYCAAFQQAAGRCGLWRTVPSGWLSLLVAVIIYLTPVWVCELGLRLAAPASAGSSSMSCKARQSVQSEIGRCA